MFKGENGIIKIVLYIDNYTYINFKYISGSGRKNFNEQFIEY